MQKELFEKIVNQLASAGVPMSVQSTVLDVLEKFDFKSEVEKVAEFRTMMCQPINHLSDEKEIVSNDVEPVIVMLIEEFGELISACGDTAKHKAANLLYNMSEELFDSLPVGEEESDDYVSLDEVQDAITDMKYHLANLSLVTGLHEIDAEAFNIIHDNNMTKATQDGTQLEEIQEKYGVTASREDAGVKGFYVYKCEHDPAGKIARGKVLKPINYIGVNLGKFIRNRLKGIK